MAERPSSRTAAALSDDGADPGLTNRLGFSALTMEPPQQELQPLGRTVAGAFKKIIEAPWTDDSDTALPSRRRIAAEEQRFRLWARTLGLFQTGHASLDYRVRDASFVKASLADLLMELRDHLQNLVDIALGTRLPLERDEEARQAGGTENEGSVSDDEASLGSSFSSMGSFQEAEFRLSSVTTRLDSLYKLASRIRSPRNRPQRLTKDLYKHVPESQRAEYIQNQEQIEISVVSYVQRQQLMEWVNDEQLQELGLGRETLVAQYASASHWLIARTGKANARRKQQFLYWKKHSRLLGLDVTEAAPAVAQLPVNAVALPQPAAASSQASKQAPAKSMGTSVTKMNLETMGPEDMRSVISHRSRVSTVASPRGEDLAWPPAPSHLAGHKYFPCPYCGILCPERYLNGDDWRVHQIHDLQPYHCTYEDCSDPDRLYCVKQEWIDHENQHRRVWHCHSHEAEFETQPEYLQHLQEQHPENKREDNTPEIIAAVVGASAKPHRDCPFCPTRFSDVTVMQKHVRYHLERLALYALPDIGEDNDDELASERSSDSHQVIENRGRRDSIKIDFVEERQTFLDLFAEERQAFKAVFASDNSDDSDLDGLTKGSTLLSKANLQLTETSLPVSWLDTYSVLQHPALSWLDGVEAYKPPITRTANLALAHKERRLSEEAEKLVAQVQVMETRKIELGADHPDTMASMFLLASAYWKQGRWGEAETMLTQALQRSEKVLGADHPSTLAIVYHLGKLYADEGRYGEAGVMYERALEGRERVLGRDHPTTLETVNKLGSFYMSQGRLSEAEAMYKRALERYEEALGPDDWTTLGSVNKLGNLYNHLGRLSDAEPMFKRALERYEEVLGPDEWTTLDTVKRLGTLYQIQGRLSDAESMFKRALKRYEGVLGQNHKTTLHMFNTFGDLYEAQGRLGDAEAMYKRALEGYEKVLGPGYTITLATVNRLGNLHEGQGRLSDAEIMYKRALEGYEKVLGPDHWTTLDTANKLGVLYEAQGRHSDAAVMFERSGLREASN